MWRNRYYSESLAKMRECVDVMNRERVAFLVELGDLKDQDETPVEANTLRYLQETDSELRRFAGPVHYVLGNHDMDSLSKEQFLNTVGRGENGPQVAAAWHPPEPGGRTRDARGRGPARAAHYSFDHSGCHFVVLDANFRTDGTPYDHGNFDYTDTFVPRPQLDWLASDLAANRDTCAIVFCHQRLDGEGTYFVNNAKEVREVLGRGNVRAVFHGHDHHGGYSKIDGVHYHTLRAMVEGSGEESSSYAVVDVGHDSVIVTGYRRAASRRLPLA